MFQRVYGPLDRILAPDKTLVPTHKDYAAALRAKREDDDYYAALMKDRRPYRLWDDVRKKL